MASPEALESINERLRALEATVGAVPPPDAAAGGGGSVVRGLRELLERFKAKEDAGFEAFVQRYKELEQYLGTDQALKEILATHQMKERIVLFAEEDFRRIAQQLERVQGLRVALDKDPVPDLPRVQARLAAAEATALVRMDEGAEVSRDVEDFLERYNAVIELLNEKFLFYHRKLAEWEALVDAKLAKRGIKA